MQIEEAVTNALELEDAYKGAPDDDGDEAPRADMANASAAGDQPVG
jgi:hypothetical protein